MEIKSTTEIDSRPVLLLPDTREVINHALKKPEDLSSQPTEFRVAQLKGTLRGLQLDNDWIEVSIDGENKNIHC